MPQRQLSPHLICARRSDSFTLVEVVMALGVFTFAIMGVFGMLLTGLQSQHTSIEQSRAIETLREATAAIYAQQPSASGSTFFLTNGFPGGANNSSLQWSYGGSSTNLPTFTAPAPDNNGQVIFVQLVPPAKQGQPLGVYMSVAWPATATTSNGTWSKAQGFQDTYISVMPPN